MGIVALHEAGLLGHLGSQNVDGLHARSGIPLERLTEVHGNMFKERCWDCGNEYVRDHLVYGGTLGSGPAGLAECAGCIARGATSCHCTGLSCVECGGL